MTNTELKFLDLVPMNLKSINDSLDNINSNLERLNKNIELLQKQASDKLND